ncbi:MAG: hypothetical protein QOE45_2553 [Frankiaceae bacterium]|nr:hypothetical protein [Frankiaceae bacterium]
MRTRTALLAALALAASPTAARATGPDAVVTTTSAGAMTHAAQGFLHGLGAGASSTLMTPLHVQNWRVNDATTYDLAKSFGAQTITWVVSDSWRSANGGMPAAAAFPAYDQFVRDLVQWSIDTDRPVTYWDAMNEPNNGYPGTREMLLMTFEHTYEAIRDVDPDARMVGPSLGRFQPYRAAPLTPEWAHDLDLSSYLDQVAAQGMADTAVSWHEIPDTSGAAVTAGGPDTAVADVGVVDGLLAARSLQGTEIHVNEYSSAADFAKPAWNVGWFAAMEQAGVAVANRACWDTSDTPTSTVYSGCAAGVDGLFLSDGVTPTAVYWTHRAYADLVGDRLTITGRDPHLSVLAARDTGGVVRVLAGRQSNDGSLPTVNVPLDVAMPSGVTSATVVVQRIPNQRGALTGPVAVSSGSVSVTSGRLALTLPSVADGEAMIVTITP